MITVADVMKLPSMYGATILAGHAGISNPVESVTVLEYGQITSTLDELFSQTEFQGNALIISSFESLYVPLMPPDIPVVYTAGIL